MVATRRGGGVYSSSGTGARGGSGIGDNARGIGAREGGDTYACSSGGWSPSSIFLE